MSGSSETTWSRGVEGDANQLRSEVYHLRNENENLRPLKTEIATLRSRMADLFYLNSEKDLGIKEA